MANTASNDPFDAPQIALGADILPSGPGALQTAVNLVNHVYAKTRLVLGVWPQGQLAAAIPYGSDDTSAAWADWLVFRVHVPAGYTTIRFVVRSARLTADTMQVRVTSDVDAGMAAATTITPNTAGSLTPTTQQATATITPGDQLLTVQYIDGSTTPGTSAIYAIALILDPITI